MPSRTYKTYAVEDRRRHLADQPNSGLSIAEYCRIHDLSISTFDNWKQKERKNNRNLFFEIPLQQAHHAIGSEIVIHGGSLSASFYPDIEIEQLTRILTAMNRAVQ